MFICICHISGAKITYKNERKLTKTLNFCVLWRKALLLLFLFLSLPSFFPSNTQLKTGLRARNCSVLSMGTSIIILGTVILLFINLLHSLRNLSLPLFFTLICLIEFKQQFIRPSARKKAFFTIIKGKKIRKGWKDILNYVLMQFII